jgi:hypothetical protein
VTVAMRKRLAVLEQQQPAAAPGSLPQRERDALGELTDALHAAIPGDCLLQREDMGPCVALRPIPGAKSHDTKVKELADRIKAGATTPEDAEVMALLPRDALAANNWSPADFVVFLVEVFQSC